MPHESVGLEKMGSLQQQSMATSVYRSAVAIAFTGDELGGNVAGRDALMGATSQAFRNAKKKKKKKKKLEMYKMKFDGQK